MLGHSIGDRFSLRISLVLVLVGIFGLYIEIINAFEYVQGARKWFIRTMMPSSVALTLIPFKD